MVVSEAAAQICSDRASFAADSSEAARQESTLAAESCKVASQESTLAASRCESVLQAACTTSESMITHAKNFTLRTDVVEAAVRGDAARASSAANRTEVAAVVCSAAVVHCDALLQSFNTSVDISNQQSVERKLSENKIETKKSKKKMQEASLFLKELEDQENELRRKKEAALTLCRISQLDIFELDLKRQLLEQPSDLDKVEIQHKLVEVQGEICQLLRMSPPSAQTTFVGSTVGENLSAALDEDLDFPPNCVFRLSCDEIFDSATSTSKIKKDTSSSAYEEEKEEGEGMAFTSTPKRGIIAQHQVAPKSACVTPPSAEW
jgi:hypothetical protein